MTTHVELSSMDYVNSINAVLAAGAWGLIPHFFLEATEEYNAVVKIVAWGAGHVIAEYINQKISTSQKEYEIKRHIPYVSAFGGIIGRCFSEGANGFITGSFTATLISITDITKLAQVIHRDSQREE